MRTRTLLRPLSLGTTLALLLAGASAEAQLIPPVAPAAHGSVPAGLTCTAEALNVSGFIDESGSAVIYNVPANQGQVRVRATCTDANGNTVSGQSLPVAPQAGGTVSFGSFDFGTSFPIPSRLAITPSSLSLSGLGSAEQLTVGSTFADLSTADVTAGARGTTYRSSNAAVATVGPNGLVTAVGNGTAIISALNEGAIGLTVVHVLSSPLQSLSVSPSAVTLAQNPLFRTPPARLHVTGLLGNSTSLDLSGASSGTTYVSSNPLVAAVSADGSIAPLSAGSAVIHVASSQGGGTVDVPVTVNAFDPAPFAAYNTPGFAHNVDIDGKLAFVADGPGGLQILDVTGGATVGKISFGGFPALDIRLRGKLAAVALGDGGFALVDVSDPTQPTLRSHTAPTGTSNDLWVSGDTLYVASTDGLHVYDITDPTAPLALGMQSFAGAPTAVAADSTRGVIAVLTAEPALVVLQAGGALPWPAVTVPLPSAVNQADDVILSGTTAYVADGTAGLIEVDLTNPASPALKAGSTLVFNALGVALQRSAEGTIVAAADNKFVNAVPLFDERLDNTFNIDFSAFPGDIQADANSTGIALGDGFGVVTVGDVGIQVFLTRQLTDNGGLAPTVALTQPLTGSPVAPGDFHFFAATAVDDVAVASVDFLVDGVVVASDTRAPFTASVPAGAPCTTQTLSARATDLAGNVGLSLPVSVAVLCADGQACSLGADCASGVCSAGSCQSCGGAGFTASDCAALKAACPNTASGTYPIDPDGAGPGAPFAAYCEMKLGGGGWTMVAKLTNQDDKHWIDDKSSWTGGSAYGNAADLSSGQDAKSPAWGALAATEFLLTDDAHKATGGYLQTTSSCLGGQTMSQFFTTALANYPDFSGDNYFGQCATFNTYVPTWATEAAWIGQTAQSPSISLNQGYLTIGYTNGGDTQAVISFYAHGLILWGPDFLTSTESEADVGLGASEQNGSPFGLGDGQKQDIGGASGCGNNDAVCKVTYPETVFMFAR
jgi:hypothetical protein